jgi:hypothetical protein
MLAKEEILSIKQDIKESSDNSELIWHRDDINSLFEHIEQQKEEIVRLNIELEEITRDRNIWRSNSLDWEREDDE